MSGNSFAWGIIGTGTVARLFARGLSFASGATLRSVCSRSKESAQAFASAYGAEKSYASLEAFLADPELEIVYIATPNHRHAVEAIAALEAGKAVLVEKPFALNVAEAEQVAAKAHETKRFCMEAMWMRFMPLVQEARRRINGGEIGKIQALTGDFSYSTIYPPGSDFLDPKKGGGALLDRGVYCLSLADYILGEPRSITSTATYDAGGVDLQTFMQLDYESGAAAQMWCSVSSSGTNSATFFGTSGRLTLHEPFCRPHRLTLDHFSSSHAGAAGPPAPAGAKDRLKEAPLVQRAFRTVQQLTKRPSLDRLEPVLGNGYNYEAEEVMNCLRQSKLESTVMPLSDSIKITRQLDQVREKANTRAR
jgi:predicted dehydrogenase